MQLYNCTRTDGQARLHAQNYTHSHTHTENEQSLKGSDRYTWICSHRKHSSRLIRHTSDWKLLHCILISPHCAAPPYIHVIKTTCGEHHTCGREEESSAISTYLPIATQGGLQKPSARIASLRNDHWPPAAPHRPMTAVNRTALPRRPIACLPRTWQRSRVWAAAWKQRSGGNEVQSRHGPEATLRSARMKRTWSVRVPLAPRAPFHAVMPPDFKKNPEGGDIFQPAQTRSLIKRRFL